MLASPETHAAFWIVAWPTRFMSPTMAHRWPTRVRRRERETSRAARCNRAPAGGARPARSRTSAWRRSWRRRPRPACRPRPEVDHAQRAAEEDQEGDERVCATPCRRMRTVASSRGALCGAPKRGSRARPGAAPSAPAGGGRRDPRPALCYICRVHGTKSPSRDIFRDFDRAGEAEAPTRARRPGGPGAPANPDLHSSSTANHSGPAPRPAARATWRGRWPRASGRSPRATVPRRLRERIVTTSCCARADRRSETSTWAPSSRARSRARCPISSSAGEPRRGRGGAALGARARVPVTLRGRRPPRWAARCERRRAHARPLGSTRSRSTPIPARAFVGAGARLAPCTKSWPGAGSRSGLSLEPGRHAEQAGSRPAASA